MDACGSSNSFKANYLSLKPLSRKESHSQWNLQKYQSIVRLSPTEKGIQTNIFNEEDFISIKNWN